MMKKRSLNAVMDDAAELPMKLSAVMLHPSHRSYAPQVLIEGDRASLEHLGKIILAVAKGDYCYFHLEPRGAGSLYFSECSELGLYFHRLPCDNAQVGEKPLSAAEVAAKNSRRKKPYARKATPRLKSRED
jgi:hypothetical protein